jgi:hypothetical protein
MFTALKPKVDNSFFSNFFVLVDGDGLMIKKTKGNC